MLVGFLFFALVLILNNSCYDYFVRFKSYDLPCSILSNDNIWIRCIINQSNPLKFFSKSSLLNVNIEFVFTSINNLTLPMNFFVDDENERVYSNYLSITKNLSIILFDTTHDSHLKQLNILTDAFLNIFPRKIHFILSDCGQPILHIERNSFRYNSIKEIFITYKNRSRTILLKNYFSDECLIDEQINFMDENENNLIKLSNFYSSNRKKQLNSIKLIINGFLLSILISLTSISMCLLIRLNIILKTVSSPYSIMQMGKTSSESSISVVSYVP